MKRIKLITYFCMLILFGYCKDVFAVESCTTSELKRLKELASNVQFTYQYDIYDAKDTDSDDSSYKEVEYKITAINLNDELVVNVKNSYESRKFTVLNNVIDGFFNGETVNLEIIAYTKNLCAGRVILTKTINLPYYNTFSLNAECLGYPEFKYCKEYGKLSINIDDFYEELENYKKELKEDNKKDNIVDDDSNNILDDYYLYIFIFTIVLIIVIASWIVINTRRKKDSDL